MQGLSDLQHRVRNTLVRDDASGIESMLVGGRDPGRRLAIHRRHYTASLVTALLGRFPATVWLVGSSFMTNAAREFAHLRPPSRPCMAEYGDAFPAFVASRPGVEMIPYLQQFAELEWHLGRLALALDGPAICSSGLAMLKGAVASICKVVLQPGVAYLQTAWAIDELIAVYWSGRAPDRFTLQRCDLWLELRGSRGELSMKRLNRGDFTFRACLVAGASLIEAALSALDADEAFDAGEAFLQLVSDGLILTIDVVEGRA